MAMDDILNELARRIELRKQIILYGPPGTGKTFTAKRLAYKLITKNDPPENLDQFKEEINELIRHRNLTIVQFHPSYNYEDFVRGIEVITSGSVT